METPKTVIPEKVIGYSSKPTSVNLTWKEAILYALGIGYTYGPEDMKYTYEYDPEFKISPTLTTPVMMDFDFQEFLTSCPGMPKYNPMSLLHGEQTKRVFRPLSLKEKYLTNAKIVDIPDKRKGALVIIEKNIYIDENGQCGELVVQTILSFFIRGIGGYGYHGKDIQTPLPKPPKRKPDFVKNEITRRDQAFIFRLSGDRNPLHVDPKMAANGGFDQCILHGLCTFGIGVRSIIQKVARGNGDLLKEARCRFTNVVFPGETLTVKGWVEGSLTKFSVTSVERNKLVMIGTALFKGTPRL